MSIAETIFLAIENGDLVRMDISSRRVGIANSDPEVRERIVDALRMADVSLLIIAEKIVRTLREAREAKSKVIETMEKQARQYEVLDAVLAAERRRAKEITDAADMEAAEIRIVARQEAAQQQVEREALNVLTDAVCKGILVKVDSDGLTVIKSGHAPLKDRIEAAVEKAAPAAIAAVGDFLQSARVFRKRIKAEACRIGYDEGRERAKEIILSLPKLLAVSLTAFHQGDLVWIPPDAPGQKGLVASARRNEVMQRLADEVMRFGLAPVFQFLEEQGGLALAFGTESAKMDASGNLAI